MRTEQGAMKDYYLSKAQLCRQRARLSSRAEAQMLKRMAVRFERAAEKCEAPS